MVRIGEHIKSITVDDIIPFFAEGRTAYLVTKHERKFIIDYKLESLEEILDPNLFFRVNRSFIVKISAIRDVLVYSNSRLKISVDPVFPKEIIVSREQGNTFKDWFNGMK
ncbi:MAG: LytTR family transcriptional regulator [Cytophagales bacterium]|nr:LytTR family transcriptional regulator [Cytophagales bacterium]